MELMLVMLLMLLRVLKCQFTNTAINCKLPNQRNIPQQAYTPETKIKQINTLRNYSFIIPTTCVPEAEKLPEQNI